MSYKYIRSLIGPEDDFKILRFNEHDVIAISIDIGMMSKSTAERYFEKIKNSVTQTFPDTKVLVHDKRIEVGKLNVSP